MASITLRQTKGSPLTNQEIDNNFTSLNNSKVEASGASPTFVNITTQGIFASGDVAVNGGDLTTTSTTATLFNTTATTLNIGQAATTLSIGATTGTATVRNATLAVTNALTVGTTLTVTGASTLNNTLAVTGNTTLTGDLAVNGGDITSTATTFNFVVSNATTLNIGQAATTVSIGATTGTATIRNATVAVTNALTVGTTLAVTGNTTLTGDLAVNGGDLTTTSTTATLFNATATTLNIGQAATTLSIGATTGTATIRNATVAVTNALTVGTTLTVTGDAAINGGVLTTTSTTATLFNSNATTLNIGQAATTLSIGATTGTTSIRNTLTLAAGTTSLAPLRLTSGTNLTSAVAGAIEYNGAAFMGTPVNTHRGIIPTEQYFRLNSTRAGSLVTTAQSIFGVGVSLAANTQYEFEIVMVLSRTGGTTTSHTLALGFGGTATLNNILYRGEGIMDNVSLPIARINSNQTNFVSNSALSLVITGATTAAANTAHFRISGTISVNAAGTFIPQYTLSATAGTAYSTVAGSYMKIYPVAASGSNASIGSWA